MKKRNVPVVQYYRCDDGREYPILGTFERDGHEYVVIHAFRRDGSKACRLTDAAITSLLTINPDNDEFRTFELEVYH